MAKLFSDLQDLATSTYVVRIVDNGGESADRYTIVTADGDYYAYSANPSHPQGVGLSGEGIDPQVLADWVERGQAIDLTIGELPEGAARCLLASINASVEDFLAAVLDPTSNAVAPTREKAEINEGVMDCFGKGIYRVGEGFAVRMDGMDAGDDRGPFMTAVDAVKATLPDEYAWAGEEYLSPRDMTKVTPEAKPLVLVHALEAIRDYEYQRDTPGAFFDGLHKDDTDAGLGIVRRTRYLSKVTGDATIVGLIGEAPAFALAHACLDQLWTLAQERWEAGQ
ncbi:hypothetical protein HOU02_gp174 [Caulobacter phage CcrBL9]|uniref:Uncharacterized protein n=1 Tax=Caulobacter phage CcrBL9 TaxID=2283270 RepID=A0A385EDF3_9CAUD|nr:hypothetical protein HOU02_gp011 [Caulobacter phage CcrBL9]YP_009810181.1 hypothetical protein HOU02_gp174 [Caulobacter phage CcrBL9]AXQ69035.1 hypothetical protein CcrBL9_gp011 [Caulobacter phage CcrBL9]AXQ69551.1 hypothetical protein CcrBL9_gp527 [Caulobacter phage CcrBL9]